MVKGDRKPWAAGGGAGKSTRCRSSCRPTRRSVFRKLWKAPRESLSHDSPRVGWGFARMEDEPSALLCSARFARQRVGRNERRASVLGARSPSPQARPAPGGGRDVWRRRTADSVLWPPVSSRVLRGIWGCASRRPTPCGPPWSETAAKRGATYPRVSAAPPGETEGTPVTCPPPRKSRARSSRGGAGRRERSLADGTEEPGLSRPREAQGLHHSEGGLRGVGAW